MTVSPANLHGGVDSGAPPSTLHKCEFLYQTQKMTNALSNLPGCCIVSSRSSRRQPVCLVLSTDSEAIIITITTMKTNRMAPHNETKRQINNSCTDNTQLSSTTCISTRKMI